MKKNHNKIVFLAVFLILGALVCYSFSNNKVKFSNQNAKAKNIATHKKNTNNNTNTKTSSLQDIVLYNSHADEAYASGKKVTDVTSLINDKFNKEGFKSSFIKCDPSKEYVKSYENSRNVLKSNIKDFNNTILLDIHRDITENDKSDTKKMLITLSKKNPHYLDNKKFAETLSKEINKSNKIKCDIVEFNAEKSYFNQDLSNNSLLIELGNNKSSDSDVEECVNVLVTAIKNIKL